MAKYLNKLTIENILSKRIVERHPIIVAIPANHNKIINQVRN